MFGFSNLHIKPAAGSLNKFAFKPIHITTTDFGQLNTVYSRMMYPREKLQINMNTFMRTEQPLLKPTFGKVSVKNACIAVPLKRIMQNAEGFFGNKPYSDGVVSNTRTFTWASLMTTFLEGYTSDTGADPNTYDFTFVGVDRNRYYKKCTDNRARWIYKLLRSLGYDLPTYMDFLSTSEDYQRLANTKLNAIPLLAYLTAYCDCFYPRTKVNNSPLSRFLYNVRTQSTEFVSCESILQYLEDVYLYYGNSYITSAWESPISPLSGTQPLSTVDTLNSQKPTYNLRADAATISPSSGITIGSNNSTLVSSRAIDYVSRVTKFFKRNMLSGSRAYESIKSQFGINIESAKHDYSTILDVHSVPLNIGDVTQTTPTDTSALGDYAGKAFVSGDSGHFSYEAKEHCFLIVFSWFSIEPFNWTGMKREVFRVKPLDFYQPEFDGLDSQAIYRGEVATSPSLADGGSGLSGSHDDMSVFGFCNRYDDMRFDNDQITGDFTLNSIAPELRNCWHFGRRDMGAIARLNYKAQSENVLRVDGSSYDNIFADMNDDADHFNAQYLFDITLFSPLQSFNEVAQLGVGELTIERNGNQLS